MARTRFDIPQVPSRWRRIRWLLLLLLPLPLLYGLSLFHAQGIADRALALSLGAGDLDRGPAWLDWRGHIHASSIRFVPSEGLAAWQADELQIDVGGWAWWLPNSFNFDLRTRPLGRLRVTFNQLLVGDSRRPALGELGPIGVSAAPFEAEGCSVAQRWSDAELREMEVNPQASQLSFDYRSRDTGLETRIEYRVAESSRAELQRWQTLPMPLTLLVVDQFPRLTRLERWSVEDLGFIRKRTRYCAQRDSIAQREMIERHLQSVSRLLETVGLEAVPAAYELYRLYARDGGDLSLELRYQKPWAAHPDATLSLDQETLAESQASLSRGEQSAQFLWPTRPIRALPEWSAGMASYDALRREQSGGGVDLGIDSAAPPLWSRRPAASLDTSGLGLPDLDAAYLLLTGGSAGPDAAANVDANVDANGPATPPAPPASAAPEVSSAAPASADATPSAGPAATPASNSQTPAPRKVLIGKRHEELGWDDLPELVGQRLRITTQSGAQRVADLIEANDAEILVRTRIGGGIAEYRIKRQAFRSASIVD